MRIFWILLIGTVFILPCPVFSSEIDLRADIEQVILYPDMALIKKSGRVSLKQGENILKLPGLAPELIDSSIQVEFRGAAKIREVRVRETYLSRLKQERLEDLKARLERLKEEIKKAENEIEIIKNLNEFLKKVIPFSRNQNITIEEIDSYLSFLEKKFSDAFIRDSELEFRLNRLREEKETVEKEINQIAGEKEKSKEVLISLDVSAQTEGMMIISYLVEGAGWSPVYDVRVDSNIPSLSIDYIASIRQATGEDWKDISLTLTTQKPVITGKIPELNPWYLDIYSPPPFIYKGAMLREKSVISEEPPEEDKKHELPEAISELTSVSFPLPYRVDIPSDGEPHRIVIATSRADAEIKYYSVPKLLRSALATVSSKNPFSFPMLSGQVNVFLDGKLVNSSVFEKPVIPEDRIVLSLGVDEGIKIERKLDRKFTEYSGTFTKSTVVNYEYSIVITNGKGRYINIEVKDHAPVSRNEKIKVELKEPRRTDAEISEDGLILWRLKVNKGETKKLSIKFTVEYPGDLRISGLE